jgi:hypothetical protein
MKPLHDNQHPYNTHSKYQLNDQNKYASDTNKNTTSKQKKQAETPKNFYVPDLDYDPIEDFKKLKEISLSMSFLSSLTSNIKCYKV